MTSKSYLRFHRDFGHVAGRLVESGRFQTALRHSSLIFKSNALCTWIPKNGCSNLRYSVAIENGIIDASHGLDWIHGNNGIFAPGLKDCYNASYSFVFLRCPVERVISAFLNKFIDGRDSERFRLMFKDFYAGQDVSERLSFSQFVKLVSRGTIRNSHWQHQSDFLLLESYDDYFDLAEFALARETLRDRIGFDLIDTRSMLKHDTSHLAEIAVPGAHDLPIVELLDLKKSGSVPTRDSFINGDLARTISEFWLRDFRLYHRHFGASKRWRDFGIRVRGH